MLIRCPSCSEAYRLDASKIKPGARFRCKKCQGVILTAEGDSAASRAGGDPKPKAADLSAPAGQDPPGDLDREGRKGRLPDPGSLPQETAGGLSRRQKIMRTLIICLLILGIHIQPLRSVVFENRFFKTADSVAEKWLEDSIKRALVAYGTARALNAVISVLKGSTVQAQPAGIGVTVAAGEVLDPLDDFVERFSWIVLVSLISLGVQRVMIEISPWLGLSLLCTSGLLFMLPHLWMENRPARLLREVGKKLLLAGLLIRFAIPGVVHLNGYAYESFLKQHHDAASSSIDREAEQFKGEENLEIQRESAPDDDTGGWAGKAKQAYNWAKQIVSEPARVVGGLKEKVDLLKQKTSDLIENFLQLAVFFVINTILLPLGFLWGFAKIGRLFFGSRERIAVDKPTAFV